MKTLKRILFIAAMLAFVGASTCVVFAKEIFVRQVFVSTNATSETITSKSTDFTDFDLDGNLGLQLNLTGTGYVTLVQAQVSIDNSTWINLTNTDYAVYSNISTNDGPATNGVMYRSLVVPVTRYLRFGLTTTGGLVTVNGYLVIH